MNMSEQLIAVQKIADTINHSVHMEESCSQFTEMGRDIFNCPDIAVVLLDENTEDIFIRSSRGLSYTFIKEFHRSMGKDIVAEVIRAQLPIMNNDISPESTVYSDLKLEHDYHSVMLAPISFDQHAAGYLYACSPDKNHFLPTDRSLFALLGNLIGYAIQKERLVNLAHKLTMLDEKANIFTYSYFRDRVQYELLRSREFKYPLSLILLDIDHYKQFRLVHGEKAGEDLYKSIVNLLRVKLDPIDLLGRHGLDEIIICRPQTNLDDTMDKTKELLELIAQEKFVPDCTITMSAGVTSMSEHNHDLVAMMNSVRIALLKAQRAGRNQACTAE